MDVVISLCSSNRKCYWSQQLYRLVIVLLLSSVTLCFAAAQTAVRNVIQDQLYHDTCQPQENHGVDLRNLLMGAVNSVHIQDSLGCSSIGNIRPNSGSLCFPISSHNSDAEEYSSCSMPFCWMLPPNLGESNSSWSLCQAPLMLMNGIFTRGSSSIKREVHDHQVLNMNDNFNSQASSATPSDGNPGVIDPGPFHSFSLPNVSINPPLLDWGANYLYAPSFAVLTIANTCNNSILLIYEPSSTNTQFFAYNFTEISLEPGKSAIIPFVFLPRWLGLSSAHLVLETSFGGFLIHAKGSAVESPYEIEPLIGLTVSSKRRLRTKLSIYNPFDYVIHVKEIQAWSLLSSAGIVYSAHAVCRTDTSSTTDEVDSPDFKEWFIVKNGQLGVPLMAIRPKRKWEVGSHRTETVMEIELLAHVDGNIFGAFCIQLQSSASENWSDTVMVPLEVEVDRIAYYSLTGLVSLHIEFLGSCENSKPSSFVLSLNNYASYLLSLVEVNEIGSSMKFFQVHYLKGLVLFPGTATHIAVVTYAPPKGSVALESEIPIMSSTCKLQIVTNDSSSPLLEISCRELITHSCSRYNSDSSFHTSKTSYVDFELKDEARKPSNSMTGSLHNIFQVSSPFKVSEIREADELILRGWRFQGTVEGMTILEDHDIVFPIVQVGNRSSKWITVNNPTQYPVIMQLVLNPGAVVNNCGDSDELPSHPLVDNMDNSRRFFGLFTLSDSAITETHVPPYGKAFLGPIIFSPSNRCEWRSTGYIRNNISGVEVLSLRGFGGLLSLILFEGSLPVRTLEFNLEVTIPSNVSRSSLFHMEGPSSICSVSLSKELFAKNIGDLPLEIKRFEISGNDCGSDGFLVHTCKGFVLAPGESRRFLISFQTDFSAPVVHRELVLGLAAGILVIPMKATLPPDVLHICRKSFSWGLLRDLSMVAVLAIFFMLFVFCRDLPNVMDSSGQDPLVGSGIPAQSPKQLHYKEDEISSSLEECVKAVVLPGSTLVSEDPGTVKELMVKIERERGRRKRRTSVLLGKVEASCSQSGNSTPSSSLSPLMPSTPKQIPVSTDIGFSSQCPSSSRTSEMGHTETGILTVKIEGNRRRKKRAAGSSLKGKFDTSSSQSGNSTPSSPLSPLMSLVHRKTSLSPDIGNISKYSPPRKLFQDNEKDQLSKASSATKIWGPEVIKYYSNCSALSANAQLSSQKKISGKPVLLPSATFPGTGRRGPGVLDAEQTIASNTIAPLARAPGSKLTKDEMRASISREEKSESREEFTYDIWGNHFSGLHMMDKSSEILTKAYNPVDDDSLSFFSKGPQVLTGKATRSVSQVSKLPFYGVHHHNQNG